MKKVIHVKKKLLGFYDYTVILTYAGMLFAINGIFNVMHESYVRAVGCLMMAGFCDLFDGAVAATKDRTPNEKLFGIQIDSLSDLISFGALPGIFVYSLSGQTFAARVIASIFVLCALIRLAYFNVLEEERQKETTGRRESYLGIPVTTIALALPIVFIVYSLGYFFSEKVFLYLLAAFAVGFISPINIHKPHTFGKVLMVLVGAIEMVGLFLLLRM